jgi:microsomal epoxide hydrolase
MAELTPFRVDIPQAVLDDLSDRLARTRWPAASPDGGWAYGSELGAVRELCEYWRTAFDWPAAEARLNEWPQFLTEIDGEQVHFVHARSAEPNAIPLVLTHGWPGSVSEFLDIVGPLTDPVAHGGSAEDAFHVVCPSIPGYGFSGPTVQEGWHVERVAAAVAELMTLLGYERYGAQGGDWGAIITMRQAKLVPERLIGIHLNMAIAGPANAENPMEGVQPEEMAGLGDMAHFTEHETGYQRIQATKPQTLGYGLTDSPAGLAAWIYEKFRAWTDCDGVPENALTRDQMLTDIMVYWATNTISSSMRLYYESQKAGMFGPLDARVEVPTGIAMFPKEIYRPPHAWLAAAFNVTQFTRFERGGHFAAMEQPTALVDDIRSFFRGLR